MHDAYIDTSDVYIDVCLTSDIAVACIIFLYYITLGSKVCH